MRATAILPGILLLTWLLLPVVALAEGITIASAPVGQIRHSPADCSYRIWVDEGGGYRRGGSGTAISENLVVTNEHVTHQGERPTVTDRHGTTWRGQTVAADSHRDIALIYVDGASLKYAELGDDPQTGQICTLYGWGGGNSGLKYGSGPARKFGSGATWMFGVRSINGDSGGGVFDAQGNLVAVNWGASPTDGEAALGTPVSWVKNLGRYLLEREIEQNQWCQYPPSFQPSRPALPPKSPVPPQPQGPTEIVLSEAQISQITLAILEAIRDDPAFKGPQGEPGQPGATGATGPPGDPAQLDLADLPPINFQILDSSGAVLDNVNRRLGETLKLQLTPQN